MKRLNESCPTVRREVRGVSIVMVAVVVMMVLGLLVLASPVRSDIATAATSAVIREEASLEETLARLGGGELLLHDQAAGGRVESAVMQHSHVHFSISGLLATVVLEQVFTNVADRFVNGIYAFPLPEDAAVRAMSMEIGERRIVGEIREKREAEAIYVAAKQAGKKASLVTQQRPNLFTNRVANIAPGETVKVRLEYVQSVAVRGDSYSLRFPTTLTQRYIPGLALPQVEETLLLDSVGWAQPTDAVPDAHEISPPQRSAAGARFLNSITITATLDMGVPLAQVDSPYHPLALQRRGGVYDIALADGDAEMDRDFVLQWRVVADSAPRAAFFSETVAGEHYGLLMVLPPAAERFDSAVPREMIFVIDTSGSMAGTSITQAKASLDLALQQLRPQDRFNVIAFESSVNLLHPAAVQATPQSVSHARTFVRRLEASGGTEMAPALRAALDSSSRVSTLTTERSQDNVLRQVIFVTDGAVGNDEALFQQIQHQLGDSRLFTVGIGSAPNSWFMRQAALFGRGTHTHIGRLSEVAEKMSMLFEQLARPAALNLQVEWPMPVEAWPARVPDLYLGQPLMVSVKMGALAPVGEGEIVVRGSVDGQPWEQSLSLQRGGDSPQWPSHDGVASLWARHKIQSFLEDLARGTNESIVRAEILPLALHHRLLSPYTSFVAVEEVVSRPADQSSVPAAVPNTLPQGQAFAYSSGATTGPAKLWMGLLCWFIALLVWVMRRPEPGMERRGG